MRYGLNYEEHTKNIFIIGYAPDGHPVFNESQLHPIQNLDHVVVGKNMISVNGWVFPYQTISRPALEWLQTQFANWLEHGSDRASWVEAIVDVFKERLSGKFDARP